MSPDPEDPIGKLLRDTEGTMPPPNYADVWVQQQKDRRRRASRKQRLRWARTTAACVGTAVLFVALGVALFDPTGMSGDLATGPDHSGGQFADWVTTTTTRSSPPTSAGSTGGVPALPPAQPGSPGGPTAPPTSLQPGPTPSPSTVPNQPRPPADPNPPIPTTTILHPSQPLPEPEPDLEELARQAYGRDYAGFYNGRVFAKLTPEALAVVWPHRTPWWVEWSLAELQAFQADADQRVAQAVRPVGINFSTEISVFSNAVQIAIDNSTPAKVEQVASHLLDGPYRIT